MSTETDFNVAPYWDDFDEEKNFARVLFRPSVPVQARELTQLQTILQNQIERFGDNILADGTIVKGCAFTFDPQNYYVKVLDLQVDGQPVNASQFANTLLINSANLTSLVISTEDGLESQNPDLNTLYIKYLNAATDGSSAYAEGEVISAYSRDRGVQTITIDAAGSGYSNNDILSFTSGTGTGAAGRVITNITGAITDYVITTEGTGYLTDPTVAVANSTGGTANGSGAALTATTVIAQLTIGSGALSANGGNYATVGTGYGMRVADGIIYQKGFFVRVDEQSVVVQKYNNEPDLRSVGFVTNESVVNNNVDTSLLDNAQGLPNYSAPGAFRLKLTPTLTAVDTANAVSTNNFFSLVDFQDGSPVTQKQTTQYSTIGREMARRTAEESGDYVIRPFNIVMDSIASNTTYIQARVGVGIAYVNGFRVQNFSTYSVPIRKGTDTQELTNVNISTSYANYILINSYKGVLPYNNAVSISLRDAVSTGTASAAGNQIGTANIRCVQFDNGTIGTTAAQYRVYLFNIVMNTGKTFKDVRSIFYNGGGSPNNGTGTVVLDTANNAILQQPNFSAAIFPTGQKAVKTLRSASANNDIEYVYTTVDQGLSFNTSGILQKNLLGTEAFPYSGTLTDVQVREFIVVPRSTSNSAATFSGTIAYTSGSNVVTGTTTAFLSEYAVNDSIVSGAGVTKRITGIGNNTSLQVDSNYAASNTSTTHKRTYPVDEPIPLTGRTGRSLSVANNTLTITLGDTIGTSLNASVSYNIERAEAQQLTKNFNPSVFVKITANNTGGTRGPWCLGLPDVVSIVSVQRAVGNDYTTNLDNVTRNFILDTGQRDTHYGLAWLKVNPQNPITLNGTDKLLVELSTFTYTTTGGGIGFFDIDSYPIDDTISANATTITTEEVPLFTSGTGTVYDLRDSVDFRPIVSNTVVTANSESTANVDPSSVEAFTASEKYLPAPNELFRCSLQFYKARYDKVVINPTGQIVAVEGVAGNVRYPPNDINGSMTIATVSVPPYPTLPTHLGSRARRPDYTTTLTTNQVRGYTMEDISQLERRITNIEYYTALNLLEQETKSLQIPSAVDPTLNRFMNGIFVDTFSDFSAIEVDDEEFTAALDTVKSELIPAFKQNKFDLTVTSPSGTTSNNDLVTLSYTHAALISQPYATKVRNVTNNYWNFTGTMKLIPSYDSYYEVRTGAQQTISTSSQSISTSSPSTTTTTTTTPRPVETTYNNQVITNLPTISPDSAPRPLSSTGS